MASTVNSSTQTMWSWMIWLCAYSAGIGPVTPTTWSAGWRRYQCADSFAPAVRGLNDGQGGVEREAEQLGGVGLRVRRRRSRRDQLGQPAGGGVQRRQEDDGGRDRGGPPGDDQEPQADQHGGVAAGQQARGRLRLIWSRDHEGPHYPRLRSLPLLSQYPPEPAEIPNHPLRSPPPLSTD